MESGQVMGEGRMRKKEEETGQVSDGGERGGEREREGMADLFTDCPTLSRLQGSKRRPGLCSWLTCRGQFKGVFDGSDRGAF